MQPKKPASASSCRPLLYLYELPRFYQWQHDNPLVRGEEYGVSLRWQRHAPFPGLPPSVRLYTSIVYGTGAALYGRARLHPCRTRDPALADLFFIPAFSGRLPAQRSICAEPLPKRLPQQRRGNCSTNVLFDRLDAVVANAATGTSYLRRHHGIDHMLPSGHQGLGLMGAWPFFELHINDRRLGRTVRIMTEEDVPSIQNWPAKRRVPPSYKSVPWSSAVHVPATTPWSELPWRQAHQRRVLIGGAFGFEGHSKVLTHPLRSALRRSCVAAPASTCTHINLRPQLTDKHANRSLGTHATSQIAALYFNSTFCLQPLGDGPTRAGIVDALLLGCIPVLFHPAQLAQWPRHWGGWARNATVLLDAERFKDPAPRKPASRETSPGGALPPPEDVVAVLAAISAERVEGMRRTIRTFAHCMHYFDLHGLPAALRAPPPDGSHAKWSAVGDEPDAFDIAVRAMWTKARARIAEGVASSKLAAQLPPRLPPDTKHEHLCRPAPEDVEEAD